MRWRRDRHNGQPCLRSECGRWAVVRLRHPPGGVGRFWLRVAATESGPACHSLWSAVAWAERMAQAAGPVKALGEGG
jgi:hypothetical protein